MATNFPAFHRVTRMMRTEQGRQRAFLCLWDKVPLAEQPGKSDAGGIEELRLVVVEMGKMKAGATAAVTGAAAAESGGLTPSPTAAESGGLTPPGSEQEGGITGSTRGGGSRA